MMDAGCWRYKGEKDAAPCLLELFSSIFSGSLLLTHSLKEQNMKTGNARGFSAANIPESKITTIIMVHIEELPCVLSTWSV